MGLYSVSNLNRTRQGVDKMESTLLVHPHVYIQAKRSRTYPTDILDLFVEHAY